MTSPLARALTGLAAAAAITMLTHASAAAALPSGTAVTDKKGDGESKKFDIHRVSVKNDGSNLIFKMALNNITATNIEPSSTDDGWNHQEATFTFGLRVDGKKKTTYFLSNEVFNDFGVLNPKADVGPVDCFDDDGPAIGLNWNFKRDTMTITLPIRCFPETHRKVSMYGYSIDGDGPDFGWWDHVNTKKASYWPKWSEWVTAKAAQKE